MTKESRHRDRTHNRRGCPFALKLWQREQVFCVYPSICGLLINTIRFTFLVLRCVKRPRRPQQQRIIHWIALFIHYFDSVLSLLYSADSPFYLSLDGAAQRKKYMRRAKNYIMYGYACI